MYKNRNTAAKAGFVASVIGLASAAQAAVPTEVTTAFASISELANGVLALVWPISIAITVGYVGIKHFKKGSNKI